MNIHDERIIMNIQYRPFDSNCLHTSVNIFISIKIKIWPGHAGNYQEFLCADFQISTQLRTVNILNEKKSFTSKIV